jgi:hypothetical protein
MASCLAISIKRVRHTYSKDILYFILIVFYLLHLVYILYHL